jgi:hypothetical protein
MKRLICLIGIFCLLVTPLQAIEYSNNKVKLIDNTVLGNTFQYDSGLNKGLTFLKGYADGSVNAKAMGNGLGIFTCDRTGATTSSGTYCDASGVITSMAATDDLPRFTQGYYDATGFHSAKGLMVEAAGTNLLTYSYTFENAAWTNTNITAADNTITAPDGTSTGSTLTATAANGTCLRAANATAQTFSVWLKRKTGTGTINITANGGTTWTAVTLTSDWCRFTETRASAAQKCGIRIVTDTDAVYVWGAQFEDNPYATSFIPTTTAAMTRSAEVLKYATAGNRTAATETMMVKFIPEWGDTIRGVAEQDYVFDTDTKKRQMLFGGRAANTHSDYYSGANTTDSVSAIALQYDVTIANNTSYVGTFSTSHTTPYQKLYLNGDILTLSEATADYIDPAWGTYFYIGCASVGTNQLNGIIQKVAFWNRALTAGEVKAASNFMAKD